MRSGCNIRVKGVENGVPPAMVKGSKESGQRELNNYMGSMRNPKVT